MCPRTIFRIQTKTGYGPYFGECHDYIRFDLDYPQNDEGIKRKPFEVEHCGFLNEEMVRNNCNVFSVISAGNMGDFNLDIVIGFITAMSEHQILFTRTIEEALDVNNSLSQQQ